MKGLKFLWSLHLVGIKYDIFDQFLNNLLLSYNQFLYNEKNSISIQPQRVVFDFARPQNDSQTE